MSLNAVNALEYALEKEVPFQVGRTLVINAPAPINIDGDVTAYQSFKPWYNALKSQTQWDVHKDWHRLGEGFDTAILVLPKQKIQAQGWIARAFQLLKKNGIIVCALDNKAGGASLAKSHKGTSSVSKNKSRVIWAQKEGFINEDICESWIENAGLQPQENTELLTAPGMFSWRKPDIGSQILLNNLPDTLPGKGADFGCGYGYLSHGILSTKNIDHLTCIDADTRSLKAAQENLKSFSNTGFEWLDLTSEAPSTMPYDWIIMNPPFHEDIKHSTQIGQDFIQNAAQSLGAKGILYMVANKHLPYEKPLRECFSDVETLAEEQGFKVIRAMV